MARRWLLASRTSSVVNFRSRSSRLPPGFGDNCKSILRDSAILTGGTMFTDELDIKLEWATIDLPSSTESITITKEDTIVLNGEGSKDSIQARCKQIRSIIADPTASEFDNMKLQERLAKVVKVGGAAKSRWGGRINMTMG